MAVEIATDARRYGVHPDVYRAEESLRRSETKLADAQGLLSVLESAQHRHLAEIAQHADEPGPPVPNEELLAGARLKGGWVQYRPPVDPKRIEAARKRIEQRTKKAEIARTRLEKTKAAAEPYDVIAACEKVGTRFVCGKSSWVYGGHTFYRGEPIPSGFLAGLPYAKRDALLRSRVIEEVIL